METNTVLQIKELKGNISTYLEQYQNYVKIQKLDLKTGQYGSENEYCINGLIGGIKNILTDISFLVRSHDLFIKISTYTERENLRTNLVNLNSYLSSNQHSYIATTLDTIKTQLRNYNLRLDKDRYVDFNSEIDNLRRKAISLDEEIKQTNERLQLSSTVKEEIDKLKIEFDERYNEITDKKENLLVAVSNFTTEFETFQALQLKATANEALIAKKLDSAIENEIDFNAFIKQIDDREKQLIKQKEQTELYNNELINYNNERKTIIQEAESLIKKSKQALRYSTAQGISAAFSTQYEEANKTWIKVSWLLGAAIFIAITLGFGIWVLTGWGINNPNHMITIIGRLTLIPFTLLGALFCANQYIKQKNLIEDYAYKSVLSKSMVAFSEELREKDPERYAEYLSTVLREIHQDPLRKRVKEKDEISAKDSASLIEKIAELLKIVIINK